MSDAPPLRARLRERAAALTRDVAALVLAARHPETPWYAKALIAVVVAYALSPVDLVPDFVPVLGLVDDVILVPLGVALAIRLIPTSVLDECRAQARDPRGGRGVGRLLAAASVVVLWVLCGGAVAWLVTLAVAG